VCCSSRLASMLQIGLVLACFFFFQAEDGIRDRNVTGVQTCALPIFAPRPSGAGCNCCYPACSPAITNGRDARMYGPVYGGRFSRSEERRVGKEGGCRWGGGDEERQREGGRGGAERSARDEGVGWRRG